MYLIEKRNEINSNEIEGYYQEKDNCQISSKNLEKGIENHTQRNKN